MLDGRSTTRDEPDRGESVVCCAGSQTVGGGEKEEGCVCKPMHHGTQIETVSAFCSSRRKCIERSNVDHPSRQGRAVLSPSEAEASSCTTSRMTWKGDKSNMGLEADEASEWEMQSQRCRLLQLSCSVE